MFRNFFRLFRKKKKEPPPRRDILKTVDNIINSEEALVKISQAITQNLPGNSMRWKQILEIINHIVAPTEAAPDPLRIEIDQEVLRLVLRHLYDKKRSIASDGLALAREFIPLMYDKHSVERGQKLSEREREQKGLTNECYAYGELDHEIFAAMYLRVTAVFGEMPEGVFYDLGCGVGTLVSGVLFQTDFMVILTMLH